MVLVYLLAAVLAALIVGGMVQQERVRLWQRHQEFLAEKHRQEVEEQKQAATVRVRDMLRQRREEVLGSSDLRAELSAQPSAQAAGPGGNGHASAKPTQSEDGGTSARPAGSLPVASAN